MDHVDGRGRRARREIEIEASPGDVWRALRDPGEWLGESLEPAEMDEGAAIAVRDGDGLRHGVVEAAEAPADDRPGRLVWWWWREDEPATRVEVVVTGGGTRTRVVVTETLPAVGPVMAAGWIGALRRLRAAAALVPA